jgi:hypothetical protein
MTIFGCKAKLDRNRDMTDIGWPRRYSSVYQRAHRSPMMRDHRPLIRRGGKPDVVNLHDLSGCGD